MEELDRILDDFTHPTRGSLRGAVFIAVDKHGMSAQHVPREYCSVLTKMDRKNHLPKSRWAIEL
jgi:hypothetical protein